MKTFKGAKDPSILLMVRHCNSLSLSLSERNQSKLIVHMKHRDKPSSYAVHLHRRLPWLCRLTRLWSSPFTRRLTSGYGLGHKQQCWCAITHTLSRWLFFFFSLRLLVVMRLWVWVYDFGGFFFFFLFFFFFSFRLLVVMRLWVLVWVCDLVVILVGCFSFSFSFPVGGEWWCCCGVWVCDLVVILVGCFSFSFSFPVVGGEWWCCCGVWVCDLVVILVVGGHGCGCGDDGSCCSCGGTGWWFYLFFVFGGGGW